LRPYPTPTRTSMLRRSVCGSEGAHDCTRKNSPLCKKYIKSSKPHSQKVSKIETFARRRTPLDCLSSTLEGLGRSVKRAGLTLRASRCLWMSFGCRWATVGMPCKLFWGSWRRRVRSSKMNSFLRKHEQQQQQQQHFNNLRRRCQNLCNRDCNS
jgi:hypothetical protein